MSTTDIPDDDNCTYHHHGKHLVEIICLTSEAGLILLINIAFLTASFRRRKNLNWKSSVFVTNVAVSDLLCSFSLIGMLANLMNFSTSEELARNFQYALQLVTTYSLGITVLNYTALFFVQYFSIQRPLIYRTRCTRIIFIEIVVGQWVFMTAYVVLKAMMIQNVERQLKFSTGELVLMVLATIFSAITYGYVLYVSAQHTMQQLERRKEKLSEKKSVAGNHGDSSNNRRGITTDMIGGDQRNGSVRSTRSQADTPPTILHPQVSHLKLAATPSSSTIMANQRVWTPKSLFLLILRDYRNTITAGLHLLVYIATFMPMWIVRVYVAIDGCPDHKHCYDRASIYACGCAWCRITLYIWYLRAIIDPILQLVRDQQLRREILDWTACMMPCLRERLAQKEEETTGQHTALTNLSSQESAAM